MKKLLRYSILTAALCAACSAANAFEVRASVNKKVVALNDSILLTVQVTGAASEVKDPILPSLPNFNAYRAGQSQNISIINGAISSSLIYTYTLAPRFVGQAVIGEIRVSYNGQTYASTPIEVKVIPPAGNQAGSQTAQQAAPQGQARRRQEDPQSPDVFAKAFVNKTSAYVNEQIILTMRFYTAVALLGNPDYTPPQTNQFLSEDLPPSRTGVETVNGRSYQFLEIRTALFGAMPGKTVITTAEIRYQARSDSDMDPFSPDFLQNFLSGNMARMTKTVKTNPITVDILPVPETGKPADFNGLTGSCSIKASVDRHQLKVGEAANLTITVAGVGNIKSITAPELPKMPAFKTYDMVTSVDISKNNDIVQGNKTFKTVLIPRMSGNQTIPEIHISYFDPASRAYKNISTMPMTLKVLPGDSNDAPQISFTGSEPSNGVKALGSDISYIKSGSPSGFSVFLASAARLEGKTIIPIILLLITALANLVVTLRNKDGGKVRHRKAYAKARSAIKQSEEMFSAGKPGDAVGVMSDALGDYLSDKLNEQINGKPFRQTLAKMRQLYPSLPEETISTLDRIWSELEQIRFAPASAHTFGAGMEPVSVRLMTLIGKLEKELKK
ncbi:MAG: BatD family protein [Elusimicrobiaceae bacterium]